MDKPINRPDARDVMGDPQINDHMLDTHKEKDGSPR